MDAVKNYPQNRQSVNAGDRRFSLIFNRREFAEVMYWIKSQTVSRRQDGGTSRKMGVMKHF